jgi:phosphoribosylformylglycinamidine synthase
LPDALAAIDLRKVRDCQLALADAVSDGLLVSAHDIAEGGLAVALAQCALAGGLGASVRIDDPGDPDTLLFGEGPGRFVVSASREVLTRLAGRVALRILGTVGGPSLMISLGSQRISLTLGELEEADGSLTALFP